MSRLGRRELFRNLAASSVLATPFMDMKGMTVESKEGLPREVRIEYLRPQEIEAAMKSVPVLYQPLGTVEWHGYHNNVGVDALKAHRLCVLAAQKSGGLVAPSLYGGIGGLNQPHTFVMEAENEIQSTLLRPWIEQLCREAVRQGFRSVVILTGHYGAGQQIVVRETAVRMSRALGVPILGTPEYMLALDVGYTGDHAAWGETSLMMHLYPGSVDLDQLGDAPHKGVGGRDPKKYATKEDGEKLTAAIVERLAVLAKKMPTWDEDIFQKFIDAEAALVARQIEMYGQTGNAWAAWRNIPKGVFSDYGEFLAEGKFDDIKEMVNAL